MPSRSRLPYGPLRGGTCAWADVTAASGAARVPMARMARRTRFMSFSTVIRGRGLGSQSTFSRSEGGAGFACNRPTPLAVALGHSPEWRVHMPANKRAHDKLSDLNDKLQNAKEAAKAGGAGEREKADLKLLEQEVAAEKMR